MTKLRLSPHLSEVKGTLSKTETSFRTWKGRQILESYPKPSYTRSPKQDKRRNLFVSCIAQWRSLSEEEKEKYKEEGEKLGLTGYQYFMKLCLTPPPIIMKYKVTIDNTQLAQQLTDYQVLLKVTNDATFFSDFNNDNTFMEVYDEDQTTLLNFWVEEWNTTNNNAKIWIKIPTIPASQKKTIYLAYNPNRTTPLSNKDNTLEFYDDFDVDLSKWTQLSGTWSLYNGNLKSPTYAGSIIRSATFQIKNVRIIARIKIVEGTDNIAAGIIFRFINANNHYIYAYDSVYSYLSFYKIVNGSRYWITGVRFTPDLNYHIFELRAYETSFKFLCDGIERFTSTDSAHNVTGYVGFRKDFAYHYFLVDYIYITKFVSPEPTISYTRM
jgi:hypothetical protein